MLHAEIKSLSINEFLLVCNFEGEVSNFNPWIKLHIDKINDPVPEGLSNRTYIGIDGEEKVRTWRTWRSSETFYPLYKIGDYFYFISSTFGNTITSKELKIIHDLDGLELVEEIPQ